MNDLVAQQRFKYENDHHLFFSFILIALFALCLFELMYSVVFKLHFLAEQANNLV